MNIKHMVKTTLLILALSSLTACRSGSEVDQEAESAAADAGLSGIDATTQRSQQLQAEAAQRAAEAQERMARAALQTTIFYFDFDIAEFRAADRDVLTFHGRDLSGNPNKRIRLEGHADERGTREYNLALAERRALNIMNFLVVNGASRSQIETVSYGEERPADNGSTETAYQRNRRVEIISR
ncbi:MAG: OmpA family protein [Pseudohongiellaceae bacterium]